jgi:hypothetical protein
VLSTLILPGDRLSSGSTNERVMNRLVVLALAVIVTGSVLGGAVASVAGQTDAEPTVTVTVDGTRMADGDRHETGTDERIEVETAVGEAAPEGAELDEIVLRVEGSRRASVTVNGTSATRTFTPDLDDGNNSVRVIVTDTAGNTNATRFTVFKDEDAPHVFLESPYQSRPFFPIEDGQTNGSAATFAGRVMDDSTVEKLRITHDYGGGQGDTYVLTDVGDNFSIPMQLGYTAADIGTNSFLITAVDEYDNVRRYTFEIDVSDGQAPEISPEPYPEETNRALFYFAGTVSDDVSVKRATVTLTPEDAGPIDNETIAKTREYQYDDGRRSVAFNETFYLERFVSYELTVSVTDVANRTTTRTYEVERVRSDENLRPEVVVDRDRTVVLDRETLFLSGAALEGQTQRLVVETRDAATGDTVDYETVHDGDYRPRVEFDREVDIGPGLTEVIVRATDPDGVEVTERFYVNGSARTAFVGNDAGDQWPAVTVTSLSDDRPNTASSAVTVRRAPAGETVRIPSLSDETVAGTGNVSLDRLAVSTAAETNVTATVAVSERDEGVTLRAPPGTRPAGTVSIQHSLPDDRVDGVTLTLTVDRGYLAAHDIDPADLTLYRRSGDEWTPLPTRVADESETAVRYTVDSPGLSVFSLAGGQPEAESTDGGLVGEFAGLASRDVTDGPRGNWTVTLPEDGSETGNESAAEPQVFVTDVGVNRTEVNVNESVTVNATLENTGDADRSYVAALRTVQGLNRTLVEKREVDVPAGEQRDVQFRTQFEEPGNHTVSVNGTQAGPVVVSEGGGLLSMLFSVLPLRLIGMGLGGLVGLAVVLTLVRFVLRRVGGGEAEG